MKFPKEKIKRVLIIRPDAIGDLVLITPAIHALRTNFPQAKISILVQQYTSDIVKVHPDIDEVLIDDIRQKKIKNIFDYLKYVKRLKAKKFDLAIDFYSFDWRYPLLMFLAGIPYRVGDRSRIGLSLFYNWGTILKYKDYSKHMVDLHLTLLKKLGIEEKEPKLYIHIPYEAEEQLKTKLAGWGITPQDFVIGIHPGCGASRPWDSNKYAELCDALQDRFQAKVIITGGPREREKAQEIVTLAKNKPLNLVEQTTLLKLMALIKRLNIYIGVDTGPIHLAAAIGTPIVLLLLAKNVKPVRWAPFRSLHLIHYPHPKSHCPIYCNPGKCRRSFCADNINVEEIIASVKQLKEQQVGNSRQDWQRLSFNVLVTYDENNQAQVKELEEKLKGQNFRYLLLPTNKIYGIKQILNLLETENILIIHHLGKKKSLLLWLANLLSGIYTTNATVLVKGLKERQSVLEQYNKAFQRSLF